MKKSLCMILVFVAACCSQRKEQAAYINGAEITVSGMITVTGNEPFTKIVLRPADGRPVILLPADFKKRGKSVIGHILTIRGRVSVSEVISASGKYRRFEYTFIDPVIVEK